MDEAAASQTPPCAICGQYRRGERTQRHLTHGISLWLCADHGTDAFMTRDGGFDFVERVAAVWAASDALTLRRRASLNAYLRRVGGVAPRRDLPGSYSWPALRREAERRFAAGEPPTQVIEDLRSTYVDAPAVVPSLRTMRRWFTQARWLVQDLLDGAVERPSLAERLGRSPIERRFIRLMLTGYGGSLLTGVAHLRGP